MKDRISALMDGELDDKSAADLIGTMPGEGAEAWRTYHVIRDAMRRTAPLSQGFTARVAWKLADEPTVLAPRRSRPEAKPRWFTLSAAAASIAAVAFVAWMAFGTQQTAPVIAPVAQVQPQQPNIVPLPSATNDYLLAHQGFSPRVSLQGMAPYVVTVAEHPETRK